MDVDVELVVRIAIILFRNNEELLSDVLQVCVKCVYTGRVVCSLLHALFSLHYVIGVEPMALMWAASRPTQDMY